MSVVNLESARRKRPEADVSTRRLQISPQAVGHFSAEGTSARERRRFTAETVKHLPAPAHGEAFYRCAVLKGFGVRVRPNGVHSYFVEVRVRNGRPQRRSLGPVNSVTFQHAQSEARRLIGLARTGENIHERPVYGDQPFAEA